VIGKFAGTKEAGSQTQKNQEDAYKQSRDKQRKENEKLWEEEFSAAGIEVCIQILTEEANKKKANRMPSVIVPGAV
jgi:hypothetical protein